MEKFKLQTEIETTIKKGVVSVYSAKLERNPLLNRKIGLRKFSSKHIPEDRKDINLFFSKFSVQ